MRKTVTLAVEKGNFDGSVLQGVWMAVSGGGQTWVISWRRRKTSQQSLETEVVLDICELFMLWQLNEGLFYMRFMSCLCIFIVKLH